MIHLYRHDLEAFIWILTYIFICFANGEELEINPLQSWLTGDYTICFEKKSAFLRRLNKQSPSSAWIDEWPIPQSLLDDLDERGGVERRIELRKFKRPRLDDDVTKVGDMVGMIDGESALSNYYKIVEYVVRGNPHTEDVAQKFDLNKGICTEHILVHART
jgi:hypothetical protein